jgi:hypothetical protein
VDGWSIVRRVGSGLGVVALLVIGAPVLATFCGTCDGYQGLVMDRLRACPEARGLLGDGIGESYFGCSCGQSETGGGTGNAAWSIPVSGSRGRGTYAYTVEEHGGRWTMTEASLESQGRSIDVLACTSPAPTAGTTASPPAEAQPAAALAAQCDANVAAACLALAAMYDEGKGVPRDPALAHKLYDRACENGLATACVLRDRDASADGR